MKKYFFTYGTDTTTFPFRGGWTVVTAPYAKAAIEYFTAKHPKDEHDNLPCAHIYTEEEFQETDMAKTNDNFGHGAWESLVCGLSTSYKPYRCQALAKASLMYYAGKYQKKPCIFTYRDLVTKNAPFYTPNYTINNVYRGQLFNIDIANKKVTFTNVTDANERNFGDTKEHNLTLFFSSITMLYEAFDEEQDWTNWESKHFDITETTRTIEAIALHPHVFLTNKDESDDFMAMLCLAPQADEAIAKWQSTYNKDNDERKPENNGSDSEYIDTANILRQKSTCITNKVGAVLVKNGKIIGRGWKCNARNMPQCTDTQGCVCDAYGTTKQHSDICPAISAEQNALLEVNKEQAKGATMYIYATCETPEKSIVIDHQYKPPTYVMRIMAQMGVTKIILPDKDNPTQMRSISIK